MAFFSISISFIVTLSFLTTFLFKSLIADSNTSFSLENFGKNVTFLALYGDAKVVNGGSSLQLTAPLPYSVGRVIYKKPIKIYGGIPKKLVSISTYSTFYISNGGLLSFVVFPYGYPLLNHVFDYNNASSSGLLSSNKKLDVLSVEFEHHIDIDSSGFMSVKVMNLSSVNLVSDNGGEKMQTWIDYQPGSKRLEVRLNKFGNSRPIDPHLFVQIDLLRIWPNNEEGVFVGFSSSNGNSSKSCKVDSWRFKAYQAPDWMHSEPLDLVNAKFNKVQQIKVVSKESDCLIKIFAALIFGIGCGSLGTFLIMFLFTLFGNRYRQPVVPEEFAVKSLQEYEHKKLQIVLDKASANEN
ncbi:agglutinin-1-like [Rutidosis leptorrhynchoides]|uniref:agglutinin-1-like n=1 Tax=Rutidosis leptorrhynchoides TaxID=125765 RepID=UPI003A9A47FC